MNEKVEKKRGKEQELKNQNLTGAHHTEEQMKPTPRPAPQPKDYEEIEY